MDLANLRGGPDNITILIAHAVGDKLATTGEYDKPLTVGGVNSSRNPGVVAYSCLGATLLGGIDLLSDGQLVDRDSIAYRRGGLDRFCRDEVNRCWKR